MIFSNIVIYEKNLPAEDYINKTIETKYKWNKINVLSMESMLGVNCCITLLHMSKRKNWIEETNQRINEFSFGCIFIPTLYSNKVSREQVKSMFKNTFGTDNNKNIHKTLQKQNTRVLALVVFYELGNINPRKIFKVLSCVIYTIIDRYVFIDYSGT